jgi:hypothetical protein
MKARVLRILAGYFNDKYNLRKENEGSAAEFTDAEIYGNRLITERETALADHVEKCAAEAGTQEMEQREKHQAEDGLNLL